MTSRPAVSARVRGALLAFCCAVAPPAAAQQPAAPAPIADNSFLLEEAYNQETGVIQHISVFQHQGDGVWGYAFTEEWPVGSQRHQLSLTVPVARAGEATGVGDLLVNYRLQALEGSRGGAWFSPRLSLVLPTGSVARGHGSGGIGAQVNLPLSVDLGARFVAHSNAGATWIPGAESAVGHEAATVGWNLGQSLIWRPASRFNVMVELAWTRAEVVDGPDATLHEDSLYLSPGVRFARDFASGLQIVPGVAVPIGIGPSRGDTGVLLYLSFEHPLR
jgi:hypothetical protein